MRKLLLILLVLLCGCSSAAAPKEETLPSSETEPYKTDEPETTPTPTPEPVEEPFVFPIEAVNTWGCSGSGISMEQNVEKKIIHLSDCHDAVLTKGSLYMLPDNTYTLSLNASSDADTTVTLSIEIEGEVLAAKDVSLNSEPQAVELSFNNNGAEIYDVFVKARFADGTSTDVHFDDLLWRRSSGNTAAAVNQLGYLPDSFKTAVFSNDPGNYFTVFRADDDTPVYHGIIGNLRDDKRYGEFNYIGDFSDLKEEGVYYLMSETGVGSFPFTISSDPYRSLYKDVLRFITLQRCGCDIPTDFGGVYGHEACHTAEANRTIYLEEFMDVSGGWHDAGDYGRYMQTSVKAAVPLLLSYLINRETIDDASLEANNGVPDVLDELRWGLDWMLKMQTEGGAVYNKVTTRLFAGLIRPEEDKENLYVLAPWTLTTAGFAGTAALASLAFAEYDPEYSARLKEAAERSGEFLLGHEPDEPFKNPSEFATGDYTDTDESDERLLAYASLYLLTGKESYYEAGKKLFESSSFTSLPSNNLYDYGRFVFIEATHAGDPFREQLLDQLIRDAENDISVLHETNYPCPLRDFSWGSNQIICDHIFLQESAWYFTGKERYRMYASHELNYLLGENTFRTSFVTGYGKIYPHNIHHRIAMLSGETVPGAMVGGVAQYLTEWTDGLRVSEDTPVGKRYIDNSENYATSEVAIGYNGCLYLALSFFVKGK